MIKSYGLPLPVYGSAYKELRMSHFIVISKNLNKLKKSTTFVGIIRQVKTTGLIAVSNIKETDK